MRAEHWNRITDLAATQLGLVTPAQAAAVGCPVRSYERAVETGGLVRVRRGVHLVRGTPPSPYQPILAACLAAGPSTVASHLAAAWLWDFGRVLPGQLEVTTTLGPTRALQGVRTHTTSKLRPGDVGRRHGVPVTAPARSAVDLASCLSPFLLAQFVDQLRRRRLATYVEIDRQLEAIGGRGRPGTRALRAVLTPRLEGLDAGDSDAEVRVVQTLMRHGLPRPEQNVQAVAGTKVYVLDLAWPRWKIAVELDGFDPHGILRSTFDHDRDRDLRLRRAGWEVIHVSTNTDLRLLAAYLRERMSASA